MKEGFKFTNEQKDIASKHISVSDMKDLEEVYLNTSIIEYNSVKDYIIHPNRILDIGCGLGRMSIYINSQLDYNPEFILVDSTNHNYNPTYSFSENNKNIFYNDLENTKEFCNLNGLVNISTIDIKNQDINSLKNVDLVMSYLSAGFHYPIEIYLNDLLNITTKDCVFIFGIRHDRRYPLYTKNTFKDTFKDIHIIDNSRYKVEDFMVMGGKL